MKKISAEEMTEGLYIILGNVKESQKDTEGNVILDVSEQKLLLLSHLSGLLNLQNLNNVKVKLIALFCKDNYKVKSEDDLIFQMLIVTDSIKKIHDFLERSRKDESYDFLEGDFLFNKKIDTIQKILVLSWYTEYMKAVDSIFGSMLDKFCLDDK